MRDQLDKYAALLLEVGLNIQPGDNLLIRLNEHGLPLARAIARRAYGLGAHDIHPVFADEDMTLSRMLLAPDAAFDSLPGFFTAFTEAAYNHNYHVLNLAAPNPELLKDADPARISRWQKVLSRSSEPLMKYTMENRVKWCVAAVASPAWAASVFPDMVPEQAVDALWRSIFSATRADTPDPVAAWKAHEAALTAHQDYLNEQAFEKLLFSAPGTDLEVFMPEGHRWLGGSSRLVGRGERFMPNIPTEEVFSMPHAFKVNGTLKSTKPLSSRGRIIDGMTFVFQDGRVTDFDAARGKDILQDMLDTDDGARRLGEVALVGDDSPISNTGILFKNTLFDENASCHFALGSAYSENHARGSEMTDDEKREAGMNKSLIHVDFMVGGPELSVVGVKPDGTRVTLLEKGNWVV